MLLLTPTWSVRSSVTTEINTDVIFRPAPRLTPDEARDARARAWAFIFDCYAKKKAAPESRPDDVRKDQDAHTATTQYTR